MVFRWYKAFTDGEENLEDESRFGRPALSINDQNVEVVRAVMVKDRRLSVRMISERTVLNKCAIHRILTDILHMREIDVKLVSKNLSLKPKQNRFDICEDFLEGLKIEPNYLEEIITRDES